MEFDWTDPAYRGFTWTTTRIITRTTNNTNDLDVLATDADVRRIVREELADILPVDVPDEPPEEWSADA